MRLKQILFPTDFSPASEPARQVAVNMAREVGASLHVVHVVPPATDPSLPAQHFTQLAQGIGGGLSVTTALLNGGAAREIIKYAREKQIDLIVLGTHGRTGVSRAILGSVAESVVRLAPCLVLSVPAALFEKAAASATVDAVLPAPRPCLVCGHTSDALVCEVCRTRIRTEALQGGPTHRAEKQEAERPGHRGLPV
jgi:nucleotide-binding universal stress UspA family protein